MLPSLRCVYGGGGSWEGNRLAMALALLLPQSCTRTRSKHESLHLLTQQIKKTHLLSVGVKEGVMQGVLGGGYVGVLTSPAGPWPRVCPTTAVSRGLKPTLSRGIPKARSFAS